MRFVVLVVAIVVGGCASNGLPAQPQPRQVCCETPAGLSCADAPDRGAEAGPVCAAFCEPCAVSSDCCDGLACNKRGYCGTATN